MTITFQTNYHTHWGQQIMVVGSIPELGNWDSQKGLCLDHKESGNWAKTFPIQRGTKQFEYKYILVDDANNILEKEWGTNRICSIDDHHNVALRDVWRAKQHPENGFYNTAFLDVLFKPKKFRAKALKKTDKSLLRFQIQAPRIQANEQLCILGSIPELGNWDYSKPLLLGNQDYPLWSGTIPFPQVAALEYKYGIYDCTAKKVAFLEAGHNRRFLPNPAQNSELTILTDAYFYHPKGNWKGAGLAIPVFALRSKKSFGVGAFSDIKLLVDWAKKTGMKLVQILPINDTSATKSWVDSYPYAAISVFALHPLYLNLKLLEGFEQAIDQRVYHKKQTELNNLEIIDYEEVMLWKLRLARQVFDREKTGFFKNKDFQKFFKTMPIG